MGGSTNLMAQLTLPSPMLNRHNHYVSDTCDKLIGNAQRDDKQT